MPSIPPAPMAVPLLDERERFRFSALVAAGRANTVRAWRRDIAYLEAWCRLVSGTALPWPAPEDLIVRFILDHFYHRDERGDLIWSMPAERDAALVALGVKRRPGPPAPATVLRRIATWAAAHRMRGLEPLMARRVIRDAIKAAADATGHRSQPMSGLPITTSLLTRVLDRCGDDLRGLRDRALLAVMFASGGRRRSEMAALARSDVQAAGPDQEWYALVLRQTKTIRDHRGVSVPVAGRAARYLAAWLAPLDGWIAQAGQGDAPLFPRIHPRSGTILASARGLSGDAVADVVKARLKSAGVDPARYSAHGLRSGFLTSAGDAEISLLSAAGLSLHRSATQALRYYRGDLGRSRAARLLDEPTDRTTAAASDPA